MLPHVSYFYLLFSALNLFIMFPSNIRHPGISHMTPELQSSPLVYLQQKDRRNRFSLLSRILSCQTLSSMESASRVEACIVWYKAGCSVLHSPASVVLFPEALPVPDPQWHAPPSGVRGSVPVRWYQSTDNIFPPHLPCPADTYRQFSPGGEGFPGKRI